MHDLPSSLTRVSSAILYTLGLLNSAYCFKILIHRDDPRNLAWGWYFQYLTIVALCLTTIAFLAGLAGDVLEAKQLYSIKNNLSLACAPLELLVTIMYWGLKTIDQSLVLPDGVPVLPVCQDLAFHLVPALALAVDVLWFSPPFAIQNSRALGLSLGIAFGYWFWMEACKSRNGNYPYPIMEKIGVGGRIGLFTLSAVVMAACSAGLSRLHVIVNGGKLVLEKMN